MIALFAAVASARRMLRRGPSAACTASRVSKTGRGTMEPENRVRDGPRPDDPRWQRVAALESSGHLDLAIDECAGILAENPNDSVAKVKLGDLCVKAARADDARELYFEAANTFAREGKAAKALALIRKGVKAGPTDSRTLWRAAELAGWSQDAAYWWEHAAALLQREGDEARSREAWDKAEEIHRIYVKKR